MPMTSSAGVGQHVIYAVAIRAEPVLYCAVALDRCSALQAILYHVNKELLTNLYHHDLLYDVTGKHSAVANAAAPTATRH
jgi:hypothetical protein